MILPSIKTGLLNPAGPSVNPEITAKLKAILKREHRNKEGLLAGNNPKSVLKGIPTETASNPVPRIVTPGNTGV